MRKRIIISALFLIGITMSVAAYTLPPVTAVDDVGITKVVNTSELLSVVIVNNQIDLVSVEIVAFTSKIEAPAMFFEKTGIFSKLLSIEPDHPVAERLKCSISKAWKPDKIYLSNCQIKQC